MRAIGIKAFGGPEVLEALVAEPAPLASGYVRVKIAFAGVNTIDVHVRRGAFLGRGEKEPAWPLILGYEGAGVVDTVGPDVEGLSPGDRVAWCGFPGAHAEVITVPAWRLVRVPEKMPLDIACALQLDGMLAHALAVSVFPVKSGDSILIQSGADPSALLLTQIAKAQGAEVIATVSRESDIGGPKSAGADHVIVLSAGDPIASVRSATRGQGCQVVYDAFGKSTIAASIACCRRRGVVVLHDGHSGAVEAVRPDDLAASGSLYLTRPHLADFMQDATEVRWRMEGLFDAWLQGLLKVGVGRILPLEAAREGHLAIEGGTAVGKILLKI
jgi:NADPH2:quinone reductase